MKKQLLLTLLYILLCYFSEAQTYTWATTDTAYQSGFLGYGSARAALAKDSFGNLIVAYAPLPDAIYADFIAIIKYDVNHNIVWTQKISALGLGSIDIGLCTDASGAVYVTNYFVGDLFFNSTACASVSGGNMFLIKMNSSGTFQWVKNSTGSQVWGLSLSSDTQNNIFVAGRINGDGYFDGVHVSNVYSYIAKYNSNGDFLWVKGVSPGSWPKIKTDAIGNTYVTGYFYNTVNFDSISVSSFGFGDMYIAKIDSSGNWLWAVHAGGIYDEELEDLAIDAQNNIYVTGFMESPTAAFGPFTLTNYSLGADDFFAAKYDSNGNVLWAIGGTTSDFGYDICTDQQDNVYLCRSGNFISKYDNAGNYLWSDIKFNVTNIDMLADDSGKVYIVGYFNDSIRFDSFHFASNLPGANQMFVAQLYDPPPIATAIHELKSYSNDFCVYPNPANRIITIKSNSPIKGEFTLRVNNSLGKTVYSEFVKVISDSFTKQIDLSTLPKGMYFIEMIADGKKSVKKIVLN